ncbi:MAG: hypothetical protein C5B49_16040 [Bdellovibrio sp.]|nr:MAG: hypothetical protein C5B49_16040 [Bdellovibrio sp.]
MNAGTSVCGGAGAYPLDQLQDILERFREAGDLKWCYQDTCAEGDIGGMSELQKFIAESGYPDESTVATTDGALIARLSGDINYALCNYTDFTSPEPLNSFLRLRTETSPVLEKLQKLFGAKSVITCESSPL